MSNIILHIANAPGKLTPHINTIKNTFDKTVALVEKHIPLYQTDVIIHENKLGAIPERGVGGRTVSPSLILITLNASFSNIETALTNNLLESFSHELHHASRWKTIGYGRTLGEVVITEGLATHFATEISGQIAPWSHALTDQECTSFLRKAQKEFGNRKYNHYAWFFGTDSSIPRWTGYALGYYLVQKYLEKHPKESAASLVNTPAEEILNP